MLAVFPLAVKPRGQPLLLRIPDPGIAKAVLRQQCAEGGRGKQIAHRAAALLFFDPDAALRRIKAAGKKPDQPLYLRALRLALRFACERGQLFCGRRIKIILAQIRHAAKQCLIFLPTQKKNSAGHIAKKRQPARIDLAQNLFLAFRLIAVPLRIADAKLAEYAAQPQIAVHQQCAPQRNIGAFCHGTV